MKKTLLTIAFVAISSAIFAQVGVGTTAPKAALDISAEDAGILIPRMSTATRTSITVASEQNGMMVYDTNTKTFWYYDNTASGWNEITIGERKFVDGDTETDAVFTGTNVGIGTGNPDEKLHVDGNILATGSLQIGDATGNATAGGTCTKSGLISYNGTHFLGCDGTYWTQLN
jgi:hypothetical protein